MNNPYKYLAALSERKYQEGDEETAMILNLAILLMRKHDRLLRAKALLNEILFVPQRSALERIQVKVETEIKIRDFLNLGYRVVMPDGELP